MAKTEQTLELERAIWKATHKMGVFGCFEVTIGWFGKERVDFMTYDTKGVWRCYEIKVSKADFRSKAHNTFIGHYNYYVMPGELYQQVKDEIPPHVGIYLDDCRCCQKSAKRQKLAVDEQILKDSMIRSLCHNAGKILADRDKTNLEREIESRKTAEKRARAAERSYQDLAWDVMQRFGRNWMDTEIKFYRHE